MSDTLAIITVVYNNYEILHDFFKSLSFQENHNFHVFIVDASPNKQEIHADDIEMTVIPSRNLGYAHGVNEGLKAAIHKGISKFCVMNNDVLFQSDFIEEILQALVKNPHTLIGGKIYYAPGFEFHKKYQKEELGKVLWYAGGAIDWAHALTHHIGVDDVDRGQYESEGPTGFITGCLACFDKTVVDTIGLWDEKYFMYYEDADYSERAKAKGISLLYLPSIRLWHKNAQSTSGSGSAFHVKNQEKSRVRYALKYAPMRTRFHILKNYLLNNLNSRPNNEIK